MRSVFDIGTDLVALADLLDESPDGELDPEAALVLDRWFAELAKDQENKLRGYAKLIRHFKTQSAVAKEESELLAKAARAEENKAKRLEQRLMDYLDFTGQTKALAGPYTFAIQANGGLVPVEIEPNTDPASVPSHYQRVRVEFDMDAIRKALSADVPLPFASMGFRGRHLRIRPA